MDTTAKHDATGNAPIVDVVETLSKLDLQALSFVHLKRLHNALQQASKRIVEETARRADDADSGDTVKIQSPVL